MLKRFAIITYEFKGKFIHGFKPFIISHFEVKSTASERFLDNNTSTRKCLCLSLFRIGCLNKYFVVFEG